MRACRSTGLGVRGAGLRRVHLALVPAVVAVAVALAGCGTPQATTRPSRSTTISRGAFTTTLRVSRTQVAAGDPISAVLTIVNRSGLNVSYFSCLGDTTLLVGIGNDAIPFNPASGAVGCSTRLHPGTNVFKETISTDYQGCGGGGFPPCGSPPIIHSLPPGSYHTVIEWQGAPSELPHPRGIPVTLTRSRKGILRGFAAPCPIVSPRSVYIYRGNTLIEQLATFGGHYADSLDPGRYTVTLEKHPAAGPSVTVHAGEVTTAPTLGVACR